MPTVEERISAVEAKLDDVAELKVMIGEFRADMTRQFADVRTDINRQFAEVRTDMDRQFSEVRSDMDQRFTEVDWRLNEVDRQPRAVPTDGLKRWSSGWSAISCGW